MFKPNIIICQSILYHNSFIPEFVKAASQTSFINKNYKGLIYCYFVDPGLSTFYNVAVCFWEIRRLPPISPIAYSEHHRREARHPSHYKIWNPSHYEIWHSSHYEMLVNSSLKMLYNTTTRCWMSKQMSYPGQCIISLTRHRIRQTNRHQDKPTLLAASTLMEEAASFAFSWKIQIILNYAFGLF